MLTSNIILLAFLSTRGGRDCGTYGRIDIHQDQYWLISKADDFPGYYTITNCNHTNFRLAKWGYSDGDMGVYNGNFNIDQLWRFVPHDDYFYIYNKKYENARIAKYGEEDGKFITYNGALNDDQLWLLKSEYQVQKQTHTIFQISNTTSTPITRKETITHGIQTQNTTSLLKQFGFTASVKFALGKIGEASGGVSDSITTTVTTQQTNSWSRTEETTFTINPHVEYTVQQEIYTFKSLDAIENFTYSSWTLASEKHLK